MHVFNNSLEYEKSKLEKADTFYINVLNVTDIKRSDFNTISGKDLQKKDIDLVFTHKSKQVSISEKFRNVDYDDILIEVYSSFNTPTSYVHGWIHKCEADVIMYFTKSKVYKINAKELKKFYFDNIDEKFLTDVFYEIRYNNSQRSLSRKLTLDIGNTDQEIRLVQAYNRSHIDFYTMSMCVTIEILRKNGVRIYENSYEIN